MKPGAILWFGFETQVPDRCRATVLDGLGLLGLARMRREQPAGGRGRPSEVWELSAPKELDALERWVKEMRHRLVDHQG